MESCHWSCRLERESPNVPEPLEKIILRCLEKHPNDRYQTAGELTSALESCRLGDNWTQTDASGWWRELELLQHPTEIRNAVAINARHRACLRRAEAGLERALGALGAGESPEFTSLEVREALAAIGEVVGRVDSEELLGEIFSSFCIGK